MSAADTAVRAFRRLEPQDLRVLMAIELGMGRHEHVPERVVPGLAGVTEREVGHRLSRLDRLGLIRRWAGAYTGYELNAAGYDCLAMNALVKAGVLEAVGKSLGVGKEADVYEALSPGGRRVAVKFHRLGRTSFRQTRRLRGYVADRRHISWLYQSRLSAEREFEALGLVHPHGVSVPEPIRQNRHAVVMGLIEGAELFQCSEVPGAEEVLEEILLNVRRAYLGAGVVHADLSEYNVILQPDGHVLIIDWPQFVRRDHADADRLLRRDVYNVVRYFRRKLGVETRLKDALAYVRGEPSRGSTLQETV